VDIKVLVSIPSPCVGRSRPRCSYFALAASLLSRHFNVSAYYIWVSPTDQRYSERPLTWSDDPVVVRLVGEAVVLEIDVVDVDRVGGVDGQ